MDMFEKKTLMFLKKTLMLLKTRVPKNNLFSNTFSQNILKNSFVQNKKLYFFFISLSNPFCSSIVRFFPKRHPFYQNFCSFSNNMMFIKKNDF